MSYVYEDLWHDEEYYVRLYLTMLNSLRWLRQPLTKPGVQWEVRDYSVRQGIQWKFIVELARWMGGFYERLVGITKRSLRKTLGNERLTEKQLSTVLIEVEAIVNSRPLVYVDDDINSSTVLTPSDFLSLHSQHIIPNIGGDDESDPDYEVEKPTTAQQLLETWKRGQKRLSQFWSLWDNEYMLSLRERVQRKLGHPELEKWYL